MFTGYQLIDGLNMWWNCFSNHKQANAVWRISFYWLQAVRRAQIDCLYCHMDWHTPWHVGCPLRHSFSNLNVHTCPLEQWWNVGSDPVGLCGAQGSAFLTSSQVLLMLLVHNPDFKSMKSYVLNVSIIAWEKNTTSVGCDPVLVVIPVLFSYSSYRTCALPCSYLDINEQKLNYDKIKINAFFPLILTSFFLWHHKVN